MFFSEIGLEPDEPILLSETILNGTVHAACKNIFWNFPFSTASPRSRYSRTMIGPNHSPSAILVAFYSVSGFSSVVLLITNKTLCLSFPMPLFTVLFQNLCALLCTILIVAVSPGFIKRFRLCHMFPSLPGSFLFVIALWLSNTSLGYTSLPVFVVANNLRPMSTALIEYGAFGTRVSLVRVCGLFAIAIGAIITACRVGWGGLCGAGGWPEQRRSGGRS